MGCQLCLSLSWLFGISAISNGYTNMMLYMLVLISSDIPCKPRKASWHGAYSLLSALISPSLISFVFHYLFHCLGWQKTRGRNGRCRWCTSTKIMVSGRIMNGIYRLNTYAVDS